MLKRILSTLSKTNTSPPFNPGSLGDPFALQIEWQPLVKGGSNFKTHSLRKIHGQRMEFRSSIGMYLFSSIFILVGLGVLGFAVSKWISGSPDLDGPAKYFLPAFGLIFSAAGSFLLYSATIPTVFDLDHGYFCKNHKKPERSIDPLKLKNYATLDQIHALQIISEWVSSSGKNSSNYNSYELNLVLTDGSRLNVVDHGNRIAIQQDAEQLAAFIGKPLWSGL